MSHGIIAINPKFRSNVGMILRLSASFGATFFYWTGDRAKPEEGYEGRIRLPREERMKDYQSVMFRNTDVIPFGFTPVAVEYREDFEKLPDFKHPENAVYVFGAEDSSIPQAVLKRCHRFVYIPSKHSLNLATAVAVTLYDRQIKNG